MNGGVMKKTIGAVILFFLLIPLTIYASEDRIVFNSWSTGDGFIYENYVETSRLMKMPDWNPERGLPPISSVKAIDIASKYVKDNEPAFKDSKISSVQLTQFLIPKYFKDKWYYNVTFMTNIPVIKSTTDSTWVVVFMDGSVGAVSKTKVQVDKDVLKRMRDNIDKKIEQ
jgi:hypothetical protein